MTSPYLSYSRSKFATRLPTDRLYTESHFWLSAVGDASAPRRVGFTRFATRMLGDIVEFDFEVARGDAIEEGQVVGWVEGFKAVAELYTPMAGIFEGGNPDLEAALDGIHNDPYDRGWLYMVAGDAPAGAVDASGYAAFLDETIDRMTGRSA